MCSDHFGVFSKQVVRLGLFPIFGPFTLESPSLLIRFGALRIFEKMLSSIWNVCTWVQRDEEGETQGFRILAWINNAYPSPPEDSGTASSRISSQKGLMGTSLNTGILLEPSLNSYQSQKGNNHHVPDHVFPMQCKCYENQCQIWPAHSSTIPSIWELLNVCWVARGLMEKYSCREVLSKHL